MDTFEHVRTLVREAVQNYLNKNKSMSEKIPISVLLAYESSNPQDILNAVTYLSDAYDVTLILNKIWLKSENNFSGMNLVRLEDLSQEQLMRLGNNSSILAIPVGSFQLLSKLTLTIDDTPEIKLALQFQLAGKPVVIATNEVELTVFQHISAPPSLKERLQSYKNILQNDCMKIVRLQQLPQTLDQVYQSWKHKQTFIFASHLEAAHREGLSELVVPENFRLTPGGKEMAKLLNIRINKLDS